MAKSNSVMDVKVALATSETWPQLSPADTGLVPELAKLGIEGVPVVWSDPAIDWNAFNAVVIRSCWDYHLRLDEFGRWIDRLPVPLFNPPDVVRWNMRKSYLLDLASKGVRIPRTEIVRDGDEVKSHGRMIVKPLVSASAFETHLFNRIEDAAGTIARLLRRGEVIIQEFVSEIVEDGEWSLVFFDRVFSHAVKKAPKRGDFRVQQELGGSADAAEAPQRVVEEARRIIGAVDGDLLYARVDVVDRKKEGVTLMELELIEPHLFLAEGKDAARRFATAINRRVRVTTGT